MFDIFRGFLNKIREINQKYSQPRIRPSRATRYALLGLRIYLLLLVALLFYKFIATVSGH